MQNKSAKDKHTYRQSQYRSSTSAAVTDVPDQQSPFITLSDLQAFINQIHNGSTSSTLSTTPGISSSWYFDSGCCNHMTFNNDILHNQRSSTHNSLIKTADNSLMHITHVGDVSTDNLLLCDTFLVPQLALNLISVGQLCELGLDVCFSNSGCYVQDPKSGEILGTGRRVGRLFEAISLSVSPKVQSKEPYAAVVVSQDIWHSRLGHISSSRLNSLISSGVLGSVQKEKLDCVSCQLAKHHALPFNNNDSISSAPFDLIHSDIWGPSPNATLEGLQYFVIFVDDYSRYTWLYLLKNRSELKQIYFDFAAMVETQFAHKIKTLRSDNAMEYREKSFLNFLASNGTTLQHSCPGTSQQNGRAERKHRHILDTVRALLISSSCPEYFWGEAALTAVHNINMIPSPIIANKSPHERLFGTPPKYDSLRVFGCVCFVLLQPHEHTKLEPRARLCCFLGYGSAHKGYKCWDPISQRIRVSRHVVFWEHKMFASISSFTTSHTTSYFTDPSIDLFPDDNPYVEVPTSVIESPPPMTLFDTPPTSSSHIPDTPSSTSTFLDDNDHSSQESTSLLSEASHDQSTFEPRHSSRESKFPTYLQQHYHCYAAVESLYEPTTYQEANSDPLWRQAIAEELQALHKAHTWDLVDPPPRKSLVGCKWVFKIKTQSDGSVERYKARLVAQGFKQEYGIDYEETFAPVARLTSVRSLLAVAASKKWELYQMDVKNAFLNGELTEEVYMRPPQGYDHPPNKVCRLRRALFGLKQAPRAWFAKFSSTVHQLGFSSSRYDQALFLRCTSKGCTLLLLYVDDMIITGDDLAGIHDLKSFLSQNFEMKDLGHLSYFLGLEISRDSHGYYLTQAKYAADLVSQAGLTDNKITSTPIEANVKLIPNDGVPLSNPTLYRQLVGRLIYLTVTRPDLAYAVHIVSQFMSSPCTNHYAVVLRILRYVKGTMFHGLRFRFDSPLILYAYTDSDWAGDPTDRRSITGNCFFLGHSLISWKSKKQTVVSRSSTEAEYRALADTTSELVWLRWLLEDMGVPQLSPTNIYCDNHSAIQIAHNDVFHERTKHIEVDCHFIRQHLLQNDLNLFAVSSKEQKADLFTKAHLPGRFSELLSKLQMGSSQPP